MTTKCPSRKQIIVPMNNDNKKNFIEKSSSHITNMNSALKNIKSEVMVDFVWVNPKDIIIVTNKVASTLDLQTIENYMKNANYINTEGVDISQLPQSKSYLLEEAISLTIVFWHQNHTLSKFLPNWIWPSSRWTFGMFRVVRQWKSWSIGASM